MAWLQTFSRHSAHSEVFSEAADPIGCYWWLLIGCFLSADEKQRQLSEEDGVVEMTAARVDRDVVSPPSQSQRQTVQFSLI